MGVAMDKLNEVREAAMWNFYHGLNCCESVYEAFFEAGVLPPKRWIIPPTPSALVLEVAWE